MAYGKDYRERAVAYKNEGHTFKQLREAFGIPPETYYDRQKKIDSGVNFGVKAKGERSRKTDREKLRQAVEAKPDAYLQELAEPFGCTPQAVFYMLGKMKITLKKNIRV
jgi:transposase